MNAASTTLSLVVLAIGMTAALANPEIPGAKQAGPIALTGATVHPVSGPPIEEATLVFNKGKIVAVGKNVKIPQAAETIDLAGKHVYPALFDANTELGLVEISAVRATVDVRETGSINPNVRALVAVNPDSEMIPVTRSNGVLLALVAPHGDLLAGRSAVVALDGWTWEDMALKSDAALHITWPRMRASRRMEDDADSKQGADKLIADLHSLLADARAYAAARKADEYYPIDARLESLQDVLAGKLPVIVRADDVRQIQSAVAFAQNEQLKLIISGGYDAPRCAELLKKCDVPVIVTAVYRLPMRTGDAYDAAYSLPTRLHEAGVRFCISASDRHAASNVRNLPYHAATAAAYGLPPEEAIKAITLYPAQILGVADRVGSLEKGKDATLIVTDGDPLETATNVSAAFVQGRKVELNDRHKRLWHKYQEKYRRMQPNK
jgi:imidazolonepropionase-like amidohydrolase